MPAAFDLSVQSSGTGLCNGWLCSPGAWFVVILPRLTQTSNEHCRLAEPVPVKCVDIDTIWCSLSTLSGTLGTLRLSRYPCIIRHVSPNFQCNPRPGGKLPCLSTVCPILSRVHCAVWSSVFQVCDRVFRLQPLLSGHEFIRFQL